MVYNNPYFQPQYQQPQQTGLVSVPNIEAARNYPVAPGNSVTFKDENAPYCYTKTVDMSQLDRPKFDRYRLVKEEDVPAVPQQSTSQQVDMSLYVTKAELDDFRNEINGLLKAASRPVTKSKEAKADV